jgi:Protein of unknwon function (DUF3008)
MPPKTSKQQRTMGAALAVKRGQSKGFGMARKIAGSMSEKQIKEYATKPKGGYPGKKKATPKAGRR